MMQAGAGKNAVSSSQEANAASNELNDSTEAIMVMLGDGIFLKNTLKHVMMRD